MSFHDKNIEEFRLNIEDKKLEKIRTLKGHGDVITAFQIDEKNNLLITGSQDSSIYSWSLDSLTF